jgi:Rhodopirellula transposase DDE domain
VINLDDIRLCWQLAAPFLDERGRRLFAANEALALGFGGVTATALATGIARSTINRGIDELQSACNEIDRRVRRPGGERKSAVTHQPGLPAALEGLIEATIRDDPCSPLRWISVGVDADTAAFAVESIRRWWYKLGQGRYPGATSLRITADCGGSNGVQVGSGSASCTALPTTPG